MNPSIAGLICACGIAGLLYLDRQATPRVSMALWIPGIWIAVVGSRSVSAWLGLSPTGNEQLEGSPLDAALYGLLLAIAIVILARRKARTQTLLLANRAILIYFLYCLISVLWSYHPDVSLKRWIKAIGDLAIVLIIATDEHPVEAIRRTLSRVGFLLLPTSVLFIMYFSDLGRAYNADGALMNTGVTTNKNMLGLTVLMLSLVAVWNLRSLLLHKDELNRGRRLVAQGVLLAFGCVLLWLADSATCVACFVLGSFLMIALGRSGIAVRPGRVHVLCFAIVCAAGITLLFSGHGGVSEALGRDASMSGRTDIWPAVIRAMPNPIVGAGFEGFWIGPGVQTFRQELLDQGWYPPLVEGLNEAHNGYIETYLNLGWIGVCLIATVLIAAYRNSIRVFRQDPELGSFILAIVAVAAIYSITEAGFRILNPAWIFLLLALVSASRFATGIVGGRPTDLVLAGDVASRSAARLGRDFKTSMSTREYSSTHQDRSRLGGRSRRGG